MQKRKQEQKQRIRIITAAIALMLIANAAGCMTAQTGNYDPAIVSATEAPLDVAPLMPTQELSGEANPMHYPVSVTPTMPVLMENPAPSPSADPPTAEVSPSPPVVAPSSSPTIRPSPTLKPSPTPSYDVTPVDERNAYLNSGSANLRTGPGTDYDIIEELKRNTKLIVTGKSGEWYRVKTKEKTGFLLAEFVEYGSAPTPTPTFNVEKIDDKKAYLNAGSANLREGPGTNFKIIAELGRNEPLIVTGRSDDWYRVKADGATGFVLADYVELGSAPTPKPSATPKPSGTPKPTKTPEPTRTPDRDDDDSGGGATFPDTGRYTEDELYLLAQLVHAEANGASLEAQAAVANVIYNRVVSSSFPDSIYDVVYQKNQFTPVNSSSFRDITPSGRSVDAVTQIFVDGNRFLPKEVLYFRAARLGKSWGNREYYATYGGNAFFS